MATLCDMCGKFEVIFVDYEYIEDGNNIFQEEIYRCDWCGCGEAITVAILPSKKINKAEKKERSIYELS